MGDYELLPHEELEALRKEIEHLKKNPYSGSKQNKNLLDSMDELSISINKLVKILEGSQEEPIKEYAEASPTKLLKQISDQNAKIAEGIVAISKIMKKPTEKQKTQPQISTPQITPTAMPKSSAFSGTNAPLRKRPLIKK